MDEARKTSSGLILIPGLEISARNAHILCYNPSKLICPKLTIRETVDRIHEQGGKAIIAHPLGFPRSLLTLRQLEVAGFDAIEVANSAQVPFGILTDIHRGMANKMGLPQIGGSDSHIPETIGRAYTVVDSDSREPEDVIEAIVSGRTEVYGSGISLVERLSIVWRKHF
jgi:predicted metal-dependent phosphoesterase TrpH